jgi:hypothetical protein
MAKLDLTTAWQELTANGIVCVGIAGAKKVELVVASALPAGDVEDSFTIDQSSTFLYPAPASGRFYARVNAGEGILKYYEV